MDPEIIEEWFKVNWVFGFMSLVIVSLLAMEKESREPITSVAFLLFFIWGGWRLVSNYILNQWGLSALDAWNLGEIDHGLPNINITIPGWIMFAILMISGLGEVRGLDEEVELMEREAKESEKKEVQNKKTEQKMTDKSSADNVVRTNEGKVDDLFDDI